MNGYGLLGPAVGPAHSRVRCAHSRLGISFLPACYSRGPHGRAQDVSPPLKPRACLASRRCSTSVTRGHGSGGGIWPGTCPLPPTGFRFRTHVTIRQSPYGQNRWTVAMGLPTDSRSLVGTQGQGDFYSKRRAAAAASGPVRSRAACFAADWSPVRERTLFTQLSGYTPLGL
jgi:hypothetical protein